MKHGGRRGSAYVYVDPNDVLSAIRQYSDAHGYSPTLRELCDATGVASASTMKRKLEELRDRGDLTYEPGKPRTIILRGSP